MINDAASTVANAVTDVATSVVNGVVSPESTGKKPKKRRTSSPDMKPEPLDLLNDPLRALHPFHKDSEEHGIVLRKFYPHEMSNDRALAYTANELPRPIELLTAALQDTAVRRRKIEAGRAVVHWFKMDLRISDNRALFLAGEKAREEGVPLICLYVVSPQDFEAHLTSPVRVDFMLRTLEVLKTDLAKLDIPLWIETVDKRKQVPWRVLDLLNKWGATHLYANMEYEVDELRREAKLVRLLTDNEIAMEVLHDTCVVPPGRLTSGSGNQYAVYTPWFRAWIRHVHENLDLLMLSDPPRKNPESTRQDFAELFDCKIPDAPDSKKLSEDEVRRFHALWPAGEHEAMKRLQKFCDEDIGGYSKHRNIPSTQGTSNLSVHFAAGTLSTRTAVRTARASNSTKRLDGGNEGIKTWISEVAWRDFYKHVLVNWPYVW